MNVPVRKIDERFLKFPKKMGYLLSDVVHLVRSTSGAEVMDTPRVPSPKLTMVALPRERIGPDCTLLAGFDTPRKFEKDRHFGIALEIFGALWIHIALGIVVSNLGTISRQVMDPESRFKTETKIEVEMKMDIPKPPTPKPEIVKPEPKKPAQVVEKPAPAPKPQQPRPIPKSIPRAAVSAPPPPRPQPVAASVAQPNKPVTGGSPANRDAPAASAAKALDFLSSGNPLKGLNTGAKGAFAPSAGRNFDAGRPVMNRANVGGVSLGEGKGPGGVGPIRTGGKFVNGDGLGMGKALAVGGTGIQGRVATGQVHGGGGPSISSGGAVEASGPGSISQNEVTALLRRNMDKFRYCYEKALLKDSSLQGVVKMSWTISTSGSASSAQVINSELNSNELHKCISNVLYALRFPPAKGASVEIRFPFVFKASTY